VKRIAAILLLCLLLFNWIGYQLYTAVLQADADKSLIASIDEDKYLDSDLILIKVPALYISSYVNSKEFQRVDGKIEIEGIQYNYVKRRFNEGKVELLCLPNHSGTRIQNAKEEFFKLVNDLQHPGQSKKSDTHNNSFKGFSSEYYAEVMTHSTPDQSLTIKKATDRYLLQIPSVYLTRAGQPPDLA
jgi:hypothetical protein